MTHDYKRNGTTTLFAALNILDGTVLGRCMQKHRHQEFIKFLNAVERSVPAGKIIHAILDNYATHKHPKVKQWLADNPRWVFNSIAELEDAIRRYIRDHNGNAKPFVWTKTAKEIFDKIDRMPAPSE